MQHNVQHSVQHIVAMGVSGAGKSTIGKAVAEAMGWPFVEGDQFHPAANIAKMSAHIPLTDDDRWPWLRQLAAEIAKFEAAGQSSVISCSALKRSYRDVLRGGAPRVRFLHVHGDRAILAARLAAREGHFFPADLPGSQYATLEELQADEDHVIVDLSLDPAAQLAAALKGLGLNAKS